MQHIALMKKNWGFLPKILSGEKKIESRWSMVKTKPWGGISAGDTIFFKNSGEFVTVKATVEKVLCFERLTEKKVQEILDTYSADIGISQREKERFFETLRGKAYCVLIYLKDPEEVLPFEINKKGFGMMSAWICVENIEQIKVLVYDRRRDGTKV